MPCHAKVFPVTTLDGRAIGDGRVGPVSRALSEILLVRGNVRGNIRTRTLLVPPRLLTRRLTHRPIAPTLLRFRRTATALCPSCDV
jgi:hypothetical protein